MVKHVILNSHNTNEKINLQNMLKNHAILVKFYSDTCGYCQEMKPEWENAIHKINNKNPKNLVILEVEASNMHNFEDEEMIKPKIMGYPTIMYLNKNKNKVQVTPFEGSRTSNEFVEFTFKNLKNSINVKKNKNKNKTKKSKKGKKGSRKTSKKGKKNKKK